MLACHIAIVAVTGCLPLSLCQIGNAEGRHENSVYGVTDQHLQESLCVVKLNSRDLIAAL